VRLTLEGRYVRLREKLARERRLAVRRTRRIKGLLETIWKARPCFVCGRSTGCRHRQPEIDLAIYEVRAARILDEMKGAYD